MRRRINDGLRRVPTQVVFAGGVAWAGALVWWAAVGRLGVDPVAALTDRTGMLALQLLVVGLWLTPVQRRTGLRVGRFKRVVGLSAFFFAALHLAIWVSLDLGFSWGTALSEVAKRTFLLVGMGAFVLLVPLALTSFNAAIRALDGVRWRRLHLLVYPAAVLALIHFAMGAKVLDSEHALWAVLLGLGLVERVLAAAERRISRLDRRG